MTVSAQRASSGSTTGWPRRPRGNIDDVLGEVLTATVTPFDAEGRVDHDRYAELCRYLVDNGSDGVVVSGTTGEAPTLSRHERLELLPVALPPIGPPPTRIPA